MIHLILAVMLTVTAVPSVWAMSPMSSSGELSKGKAAPEFTLETDFGQSASLSAVRDGKKALMFFWATWCPHCHEELERIRQKLDQLKQEDVKVILVNVGESREDVRSFLKSRQILVDSFVDEDNTVAGLYGVIGLPTVFLIDEKGIIRGVEHEFPFDYMKKLNAK